MKWLVVFLVCLTRYSEGGALRCASGDCLPLKKETSRNETRNTSSCKALYYRQDCAFCYCFESGVPGCWTQEDCFRTYQIPDKLINCIPKQMFKRDCNTCICMDNGYALCTSNDCQKSTIPKKSELGTGKECAKGSHWQSQCNDCVCSEDGYAMCTEKACIGQESEPLMKCAPDTLWNNDCNTCWCTADGRAMCTRIGCNVEVAPELTSATKSDIQNLPELGIDHSEHSVCKPRGTFYIGCNTCHCNLYGTDYSCTNKPCPLPEDVEIFHELKANSTKTPKNNTRKIVCVANRMFIKDCNTCWCNEDGTGFFCTRKVCVPEEPEEGFEEEKPEELRIIKKDCRPDEVFEIDCNMCRCNPDGKTFSCTRRACVDTIEEDSKNTTLSRKTRGVSTQEAPKTCQPGQEFRMDCNKCLCDNEGQDFSCTRNDCNANGNGGGPRTKRDTSEKIAMECTPESVFDKDCNVCRCTSDGHHAMCTTKPCPAPNAQENDVSAPLPEADPNFRCNPGEQFKRGCNDCSCSADGKSVFCTVKFCDQDITPPPSL